VGEYTHPTKLDTSIHIDLDGAWNAGEIGFPTLDFRTTGPGLRYICTQSDIDEFNRHLRKSLPRFILYGSGDFHHLAALWLRRAIDSDATGDRVTLISFDNHPDWDIRPPRWACGGWINRALELPAVYQAHVWGCGNFELAWPHRLFANRKALKSGRLNVHAWKERQPESVRRLFNCMTRQSWRDRWLHVIASLPTKKVYVTIDLDCLTSSAAQTNWENGLFTVEDIAWAITELRSRATVIGGDLCGAWSPTQATGAFRKLAIWWDHPRIPQPVPKVAAAINLASLKTIWPALSGGGQIML
jgi:arginase family enzyme